MSISRFDINSAEDRLLFVNAQGHLLNLPTRPGTSSTVTTGVPTNGIQGFAPGALMINFKGSLGTLLYVNVGTFTSSLWLNLDGGSQVDGVLPQYQYATGTTTTTFAANQLTGGQLSVYNSTATTPGSIATRTAAQMFADITGTFGFAPYIGLAWVARIINSSGSANTMTVTAGVGVTLSGTTTYTIAEFAYRDFLFTFGGTAAAPTLTMVAICGGAAATN
jgi:hypothetical protein